MLEIARDLQIPEMIRVLFRRLVKPRCSCCGARRKIFRHGKCYACYQAELDVLADHKIITEDARDFWRRLKG